MAKSRPPPFWATHRPRSKDGLVNMYYTTARFTYNNYWIIFRNRATGYWKTLLRLSGSTHLASSAAGNIARWGSNNSKSKGLLSLISSILKLSYVVILYEFQLYPHIGNHHCIYLTGASYATSACSSWTTLATDAREGCGSRSTWNTGGPWGAKWRSYTFKMDQMESQGSKRKPIKTPAGTGLIRRHRYKFVSARSCQPNFWWFYADHSRRESKAIY